MARLHDVVVDCRHAPSLSRFWAAALDGYAVAPYGPEQDPETDTNVLVESSDGHARLWFQQVSESKVVKNRVHLDVVCDDVTAEVERLVALGAAVVAARPNLPHGLVSMRDPEGNEFCVSKDQGGSREQFALSAAVYVVRADGKVLLLQRADGGALAGQYFVPGGKVEAGELPIDAAARELFEESGLVVDELRPVGSFPIVLSGHRSLALTYWARVRDPTVTLSTEHTAYQWIDPNEMVGLLTDDVISNIARGRSEIVTFLKCIREDRRRFLTLW
jgi:8-oxo-dGTP pyrophosphatase MutT (NUDIX family)